MEEISQTIKIVINDISIENHFDASIHHYLVSIEEGKIVLKYDTNNLKKFVEIRFMLEEKFNISLRSSNNYILTEKTTKNKRKAKELIERLIRIIPFISFVLPQQDMSLEFTFIPKTGLIFISNNKGLNPKLYWKRIYIVYEDGLYKVMILPYKEFNVCTSNKDPMFYLKILNSEALEMFFYLLINNDKKTNPMITYRLYDQVSNCSVIKTAIIPIKESLLFFKDIFDILQTA